MCCCFQKEYTPVQYGWPFAREAWFETRWQCEKANLNYYRYWLRDFSVFVIFRAFGEAICQEATKSQSGARICVQLHSVLCCKQYILSRRIWWLDGRPASRQFKRWAWYELLFCAAVWLVVKYSDTITALLDSYLKNNCGSVETDGGKNVNRDKVLASGTRTFFFA